MEMNKSIFQSIALIIIFNSCNIFNCQYKVYQDRITTNCSLYNGVDIKRISNITEFKDNIPVNYDVDAWTTCGTNSTEILEKNMKKKLKTIYFHKKNEGYSWIYHGHAKVTDTMPFKLEPSNWYVFSRLYQNGYPSVFLYVHIDAENKINMYRYDKPTNW